MSDSAQQDQAGASHQDIEKQLDALLGGMPAGPSQPTSVAANVTEDASPDTAQAPDGDDLAEQIQQMLDEARKAAETESAGTQPDESAAVEAVTTQAVGEGDKSVEGSQLVQELDDLLADEADGAVAGEFETPEQVLSVAATPDAVADEMSSPAADGESVDRDQAESAAAAEDEDSLDGAFETPEELMARAREEEEAQQAKSAIAEAKEPAPDKQPPPTGRPAKAPTSFAAAAADVARELDEQEAAAAAPAAEVKAAAPSALDRALATDETDASVEPPASPPKPRGPSKLKTAVRIVPGVAKGVCATINRPLASLAPQTRNTIGYVGLLTLFNASVLLIYKICTTMF